MDLNILDSAPKGLESPIVVLKAIRSEVPIDKDKVYVADSKNPEIRELLRRGELQYVSDKVRSGKPLPFISFLGKPGEKNVIESPSGNQAAHQPNAAGETPKRKVRKNVTKRHASISNTVASRANHD